MSKSYVVSADVRLALVPWAARMNFTLPDDSFFAALREEFCRYMRSVFPCFDRIEEGELNSGLRHLILQGGLPVVSLDRLYVEAAYHLDVARAVRLDGEDVGLGHRYGSPPLLQQIRFLKYQGLSEVMLVDDVIFSGGFMERIVTLLECVGIRVPLVCAGVGIQEGIARMREHGTEVQCVREYEYVIDEVCERDFFPGVPYSGRMLIGAENVGMPYVRPFGNAEKWASIPSECTYDHAALCVRLTRELFKEIENCSGRAVLCNELGRFVVGLPNDTTRFVDALNAHV